MKNAVKLSILVFMMSTSMVFANVNLPIEDLPKAMTEISLLLNEGIDLDGIENLNSVKVMFTVNSDSEILVLDVRTNDKGLKQYIKSKLNHKSLNLGDLTPGKQYSFKVILKK